MKHNQRTILLIYTPKHISRYADRKEQHQSSCELLTN